MSNIANMPLVPSVASTNPVTMANLQGGFNAMTSTPGASTAFLKDNLYNIGMAASPMMAVDPYKGPKTDPAMIRPFEYVATNTSGQDPYSIGDTSERLQYSGEYRALEPYEASEAYKKKNPFMAQGGVVAFQEGGLAGIPINFSAGRFLEGPGDGTSDDIPAVIANRQPARLADGEYVLDARTVSEIGNGSSKAGARKLQAMVDRVHEARKTAKRGKNSNADKYLPT
jgi:hypothetical protein